MPTVQIEVTTRCNFDCWYCTGRQYEKHSDMEWGTFLETLDRVPYGATVQLQGEGESTLWKHWREAVALAASRFNIYSIINGSRIDVDHIARYFPKIGVSLDTLDPVQAAAIGRHNLPKVLDNLRQLAAAMPGRVNICTTLCGQDVRGIKEFAHSINAVHQTQTLQDKADYVTFYPDRVKRPHRVPGYTSYRCPIIDNGNAYVTVNGTWLPCPYIKRDQDTFNLEVAAKQMQRGEVPVHCTGCRMIRLSIKA